MLYNELEQEDILSEVRLRLATIAYVDILLRSIGPVYKIRQTPDPMREGREYNDVFPALGNGGLHAGTLPLGRRPWHSFWPMV